MIWIAIILGVLLVACFRLYRRSVKESQDLGNYALLILLDERVYAAQKNGLEQLVKKIDAKDAADLGMKVTLSLSNLASNLGHTLLGTAGLLWKLRTTNP
jgi:hypothetical protein